MKSARITRGPAGAETYDFRALLRERLRAARQRNPRFSLRGFAQRLGVDHSTLSQVLRGKRVLTARMVEALGRRLGLGEEAIETYAQSYRKRTAPRRPAPDIRQVQFDPDTFQLVSVWYHAALLELTHVRGFRTDSRWIAKTLGISVEEANVALQRLLRLRLLEMTGRNRWKDKSGDAEFQSAEMTEALGDQISQDVHELAIEAVKRIASENRAHAQMMVALDSRRLAGLRKLASEFLSEVRSAAAEKGAKDDVYQVEVSIFPVTTLKQRKGEKHG